MALTFYGSWSMFAFSWFISPHGIKLVSTVRPHRHCPPRHQHDFEPSFLELNGIV